MLGSGFLSITAFNLLLSFAQLAAPTSRAVIVTFTMPIWTIIFARPVLGERLDRRRWTGLAAGSLGLVCLGWPLVQSGSFGYGLVLALLAGMSWALGTVVIKRFPVAAPPITMTLWQLVAGALVAAAGAALFEPQLLRAGLDPAGWHASTWVGLGYHIVFSQALAFLLWYWLLARMPAGTVALALLLVPAIGVVSSVLLLAERPTLADMLGLVLMTTAAAAVMLPASATRPRASCGRGGVGGATRPAHSACKLPEGRGNNSTQTRSRVPIRLHPSGRRSKAPCGFSSGAAADRRCGGSNG